MHASPDSTCACVSSSESPRQKTSPDNFIRKKHSATASSKDYSDERLEGAADASHGHGCIHPASSSSDFAGELVRVRFFLQPTLQLPIREACPSSESDSASFGAESDPYSTSWRRSATDSHYWKSYVFSLATIPPCHGLK